MQANQTQVMWSIWIAAVLIGIGLVLAVSSVNSSIQNIDFPEPEAVPTSEEIANSLLGQLPAFPDVSSKLDAVCNEIDGCGGSWDVDDDDRKKYANRTVVELTDDKNRDIYRAIRDLVDVDDNEDVLNVSLDQTGDIESNENPNRELSENTVVTVDIVLEVKYEEDGDSNDTPTDYFRVRATIDDLEDGVGSSDVSIDSVEEVSRKFVLP